MNIDNAREFIFLSSGYNMTDEQIKEIVRLLGIREFEKREALDLIKLLSAVESWSLSVKERMPDYLLDAISGEIEMLEKVVLGE
jgi:hypothetical protein